MRMNHDECRKPKSIPEPWYCKMAYLHVKCTHVHVALSRNIPALGHILLYTWVVKNCFTFKLVLSVLNNISFTAVGQWVLYYDKTELPETPLTALNSNDLFQVVNGRHIACGAWWTCARGRVQAAHSHINVTEITELLFSEVLCSLLHSYENGL